MFSRHVLVRLQRLAFNVLQRVDCETVDDRSSHLDRRNLVMGYALISRHGLGQYRLGLGASSSGNTTNSYQMVDVMLVPMNESSSVS